METGIDVKLRREWAGVHPVGNLLKVLSGGAGGGKKLGAQTRGKYFENTVADPFAFIHCKSQCRPTIRRISLFRSYNFPLRSWNWTLYDRGIRHVEFFPRIDAHVSRQINFSPSIEQSEIVMITLVKIWKWNFREI